MVAKMGLSVNHQRGGFQRVNFRVIPSPLRVKALIPMVWVMEELDSSNPLIFKICQSYMLDSAPRGLTRRNVLICHEVTPYFTLGAYMVKILERLVDNPEGRRFLA